MSGSARGFVLLVVVGLAAFAAAWTAIGDLQPHGDAYRTAALQRALVVDHDLDLFPETGPLGPVVGQVGTAALPPVAPAYLTAPLFSLAHVVSRHSDAWMPDGGNPLYGLTLALGGQLALWMGLVLLGRVLIRDGAGGWTAGIAILGYAAASPLFGDTLAVPAPASALAFLFVALLLGTRAARMPAAVRVVAAAALVAVDLRALGWVGLVAWDLAGRGAQAADDDDSAGPGTLAVVALLFAPQLFASYLHDGSPLAGIGAPTANISNFVEFISFNHPVTALGLAGFALLAIRDETWRPALVPLALAIALAPPGGAHAAAAPALVLGFGELVRRFAQAGLTLAATLGTAALVAGNAALLLATRAGAASHPLGALAWLAQAPARHLELALAPADGSLPPWLVAQYLTLPPWGPAVVAYVGGLLALWLALRRASAVPLSAYVGLTSIAGLGLVLSTTLATQELRTASWAGGRVFLDGAHVDHSWYPPAGTEATTVELDTSIDRVYSMRTGDAVARLVVRDVHGRVFDWLLTAGQDTADEAQFLASPLFRAPDAPPGRKTFSPLLDHVARYGATARSVRQLTLGECYRRTFALPERLQIAEVHLERRNAYTRMDLRGIWLGNTTHRIGAWR